MEFARCAAELSATIYLEPCDIVSAIPIIAREYDEPFSDASAVPTYFCAKVAREADSGAVFHRGNGGNEIFRAWRAMPSSAYSKPTRMFLPCCGEA